MNRNTDFLNARAIRHLITLDNARIDDYIARADALIAQTDWDADEAHNAPLVAGAGVYNAVARTLYDRVRAYEAAWEAAIEREARRRQQLHAEFGAW